MHLDARMTRSDDVRSSFLAFIRRNSLDKNKSRSTLDNSQQTTPRTFSKDTNLDSAGEISRHDGQ